MQGHCLCGAVTVRVTGTHDPRVGACHCRMCQRWSGGLFLCFEAREVQVMGEVARYRSSPFAERAFCPVCGTHLWMRDLGEDGTAAVDAPYDLMPGLFDAARAWPMRSEIYTDRAIAGVVLAGDHRRATRAEYEARNDHIGGDLP
jgi:hypothetical protein